MDEQTKQDLQLIDSAIALLKLDRNEHVQLVNALQRLEKMAEAATAPVPVRRGRPKGSKNKKNGSPRPITEAETQAT